MPDVDPDERIDIAHPSLPGQVGSCFRFQLPVFEANGWAEKPSAEEAPSSNPAAPRPAQEV